MIFDLDKHSGTALIDDKGLELSYHDLAKSVNEVSDIFATSRSLVFCLCSNTIGSIVAYLSCLESGSPAVLLDKDKVDDLLLPLIECYQPNFIWAPEHRELPAGKPVFASYGYRLWHLSDAKHKINSELALLLTTSGSTGSPKLVRLSKKNILANARSISQYLGIDSGERPVTSLPMYYSYGLSVINSHILKGAAILLTDKSILQREFWTFVKDRGATSFAGVPYTYEMLRRLRFFKMELPQLRTLTQAGGKLQPKLVKEFVENSIACGKRFIVMYGQTEATARMSYTPTEFALEKYSSIGVPIPGGRFTIMDANDNEISEPDTEGELVYMGDNVSLGYAENISDLAKGDENHGILRTGDLGKYDSDGFYYITGRLKRFVKIWGNRCNLDAMEMILKPHFQNIACVGVDDLITIFTTEDGREDDIRTLCSKLTGLHVKAFKVVGIKEIPKTASGKTSYAELQKMIE